MGVLLTNNWFRDESSNILGPNSPELSIELGFQLSDIRGFAIHYMSNAPVGVAGAHPASVDAENRLENGPAGYMATGCQGTERGTVIALISGNVQRSLRLRIRLLKVVLSCQLEGGFHGLAAAADEEGSGHLAVGAVDEQVGQLFGSSSSIEERVAV